MGLVSCTWKRCRVKPVVETLVYQRIWPEKKIWIISFHFLVRSWSTFSKLRILLTRTGSKIFRYFLGSYSSSYITSHLHSHNTSYWQIFTETNSGTYATSKISHGISMHLYSAALELWNTKFMLELPAALAFAIAVAKPRATSTFSPDNLIVA